MCIETFFLSWDKPFRHLLHGHLEIARLLDAYFIKEVYHPDWFTDPILVPKKNKEWMICVDYTDFNKSYKKDPFDLPRID
jgi:hypothetical protein